jgi:comEA protein
MSPPRDWTTGPAKWAAVLVLGSASLAGMTWSIFWRERAHPPPVLAAPPPAQAIQREEASLASAAPAAAPQPPPRQAPALTRTININTASGAELELLPGIGPALAGHILEYRQKNGPFTSVDQLDNVKGIGPRTLERLRPLVRVQEPPTMP